VSPGIYAHSLSEKEIHNYILAHAKALDKAVKEHGISVVFLPHYVSGFHYDDLELCKLILGKMENGDKAKIAEAKSVEEFKSLISRVDMVVSSKMHPAVLAASAYVPFVFIVYDHKQTGFASSLGLGDCVLSIQEVSCERLFSKIDYVWNRRDDVRALLRNRVPELQRHVKETIASVMAPFIRHAS
jgi:polysaccharide pyruvyl transferase WcaK-like protein